MKAKALLSVACLGFGALIVSAKTYTVHTAEEFINALGPDRTVVVESVNPLILTPVIERLAQETSIPTYDYYGSNNYVGLGYYDNQDGPALAVVGFMNLTIKGQGPADVTILSQPRYADVITFEDCHNLNISNIVMGHTDEGYCEGAVVSLRRCSNVNITGSDFFGCGTEGFIISGSNNIVVEASAVHNCSYHTMHLLNSKNITFKDCLFRDNRQFEQINVNNCENVAFTNSVFSNLQGPLFNINSLTTFVNCSFLNCSLVNESDSDAVKMINCNYMDTQDEAQSEAANSQGNPALFPPAYPNGTPAEMLFGDWLYEDKNTTPITSERISIGNDWSFYVSTQEGSDQPGQYFDNIVNYYGKCWEKERLSNNEVIIEYRIESTNNSDNGFKNKKKTIKGKFRITQCYDDGAYWVLTPIDGLRFGIPKGKSRKFKYELIAG